LLIASERSIGAMPQFARVEPLHRNNARRLLNRRGDLFRCLDALAGDVDNAEQDILAV
jgi:hypothetical protein